MQKNNIEQFIFHNKEYKSLIIRVSEIVEFLNETNSFKTLFFVDENKIRVINNLLNMYSNINVAYQSFIENSENKYVCFYHKKYNKSIPKSVSLVKIQYRNKFVSICHKDILGALMNLRIDRNYLGDIILFEDNYYFEIANHLIDYVIANVEYINKVKVELIVINHPIIRKQDYLSKQVVVNSLRLDNVVSSIIKLSREKCKEYILDNNVKVNQIQVCNISYICENSDVLSLKGYGRYKIECNINNTNKKNKYKLIYHKYI